MFLLWYSEDPFLKQSLIVGITSSISPAECSFLLIIFATTWMVVLAIAKVNIGELALLVQGQMWVETVGHTGSQRESKYTIGW